MVKLTKLQRQLLQFIHQYTKDFGRPPALWDMVNHLEHNSLNWSTLAVKRFEVLGLITKKIARARTVRLTDKGLEVLGV